MGIDRELEDLAERLRPLGHPLRLSLLARIARVPDQCVCELAAALAADQPAVSHHLGILRGAGLVTRKRSGARVAYSIADSAAHTVLNALHEVLMPTTTEKDER